MSQPPTQLATLADVAARFGVSQRTVRRRIAEGKITAYRFGPTLIRVDPDEVASLLTPIPTAGSAA